MRRVAEIIYIVPEKREEFIKNSVNPPEEMQRVLWMHGVRNQFFFELNDYVLMTFEYVGREFRKDMNIVSSYMEEQGYLIKKRRRDVPESERAVTDWWAPLKRLGSVVTSNPMPEDKEEELSLTEQYRQMLNGCMEEGSGNYDTSYDEDDWSESVHI